MPYTFRPPDSQPDVCGVTLKDCQPSGLFVSRPQGEHQESNETVNKQTGFVLKKAASSYLVLKIQSANASIQYRTNCTTILHVTVVAKTKHSVTFRRDYMFDFKNPLIKVCDVRFPGLCLETQWGAQQQRSDGGSNTSTFRDLPWQTFRLCPAEGNAFDGDMKRTKNRNEKKLDHIAFGRFRLKTARHGEAIRKEETLWPHCQLSCYTTNTSQVSLYSFSSSCCLSLSSISYQELPPINRESRHQVRNLRRLDLFSRLSNHHFQPQPVLREGRWTTWNHLNAGGTSRFWGWNYSTMAHSSAVPVGKRSRRVLVTLVDHCKITKQTGAFVLKVHPSQYSLINHQQRGGGGWKHDDEYDNLDGKQRL